MRRKEELRFLKRTLSLDESHNWTATYRAEGTFWASLGPAEKRNQSGAMKERLILIGKNDAAIEEGDRIESSRGIYRTLWIRSFPKHTEALLEKEDPKA